MAHQNMLEKKRLVCLPQFSSLSVGHKGKLKKLVKRSVFGTLQTAISNIPQFTQKYAIFNMQT